LQSDSGEMYQLLKDFEKFDRELGKNMHNNDLQEVRLYLLHIMLPSHIILILDMRPFLLQNWKKKIVTIQDFIVLIEMSYIQ